MAYHYKIREIAIEDLNKIYSIGESQKLDQWNSEELASILIDDNNISLVAVTGKKIIGFLISQENEENSILIKWITNINNSKFSWINEKLILSLIERSKQKEIKRVKFIANKQNNKNISILKKMDFTEIDNHQTICFSYQEDIKDER